MSSLRNKIWEALKQTKCNEICLLRQTDKIRKRNRYVKYAIICFSALGSISYMFNSLGALLASIIIFIISLSKESIPMLSRSENDLKDMGDLIEFYINHMSKLDILWRKNKLPEADEIALSKSLQKLTQSEARKKISMNELVRHISKKENKIISDQADTYLKNTYYE